MFQFVDIVFYQKTPHIKRWGADIYLATYNVISLLFSDHKVQKPFSNFQFEYKKELILQKSYTIAL